MTLREFGRLSGEEWGQPFRAKLGKAAAKLYREIYKKEPSKRRASMAFRNKVGKYPCGILEQAYRRLRAESNTGPAEPQGAGTSGDAQR